MLVDRQTGAAVLKLPVGAAAAGTAASAIAVAKSQRVILTFISLPDACASGRLAKDGRAG